MLKDLKISSRKFIFILSLYFSFILNITFINQVIQNYKISGTLSFFCALFLIVIIPLPIYILFNIFLTKYLIKPLTIFLLITSSATNYMMYKMGIRIDTSMIRNVFETNTREALDLITFSGFLWVFITGIIPSIIVYKTKIYFNSLKFEFIRRSCVITLSLLLLIVYTASFYKVLAPFGRNNSKIQSLYNTANYIYSTIRYVNELQSQNKEFEIIDPNPKPDMFTDNLTDVMIIVVGETARAQNFQLNGYNKETNPLLSKEKNLVYLNDVSSCGTATAISLPCMFSSKHKSNFDVSNAKFEENILDILQKSGWKIIWKDNDDGCKGVCNRVENYNMVDTKHPKYCFGNYCHDEVLLEGLDDILKNIKPKEKTVIVLHTMGSHGPTYYKRYPDKFKKFTPTCDTADIQSCTTEELVNTYDNTILYTDYIVASAINTIKKYKNFESSVLYISDHGESLGENGVYLHGLPYSIAPKEQTSVPFILWFSDNILKYDHLDFDCIKNNKLHTDSISHDFFFHTLLGLSETDSSLYNKDYDILTNCRLKKTNFMKR